MVWYKDKNLPCKGRGTACGGRIIYMYNHNKKLTPLAKTLRKNMTKEENKLWYQYLRQYPIRFLRQKVINNYIVDFYCSKVKLIIELDGSQHYETTGINKDKNRNFELSQLGYKILRFSNLDINSNFEGVCETINSTIKTLLS